MDPVTHLLTGACLGRSGFNRRTAYATLAMTLAAEAPDLDVLWGLRGPVAGFEHHRGITHTLLGAPFVALAVMAFIWLFDRFRARRPPIPTRWFLIWFFSLLAVFSHIFLDWTNDYGIRPFFPFRSSWHALNIVFIVEPVILGALFLGLIVPMIFRRVGRETGPRKSIFRGRAGAIAALCFSMAVTGIRFAEHDRAQRLVENTRFGGEPMIRAGLEPYPGNPFRWFAIVETAGYYQTGSVNTYTGKVETDARKDVYLKTPISTETAAAERSWLGRVYLDWAKFPLTSDRGRADLVPSAKLAPNPLDRAVEFRDLRFFHGPLGGDSDPPLSGWVYLTPRGKIDAMVMNDRLQKDQPVGNGKSILRFLELFLDRTPRAPENSSQENPSTAP